MIVELDSSLFNNNLNFQKLNHLFVFFETGKHTLYLNEDISLSQWVISNNYFKSFCEISYKDSAYIQKKDIQLKIDLENNIKSKIYSLHDGYLYLENNLIIFVENATSDRLFLNSIFKNFIPECDNINIAIRNRWINIIGPGGKNEIKKTINNELRKYRSEKSCNDIYVRAIVIIDSDKKFPDDDIGKAQIELEQYCVDKNIVCHILSKREIENYIPFEAFEHLSDKSIVKEYKKLTNEQSSFYDLEKGFGVKLENQKDEIKELFRGINVTQEGILRDGFKSIDGFNPKQEIPKLFNNKNISRKSLADKCDDNELLEIINEINKLL